MALTFGAVNTDRVAITGHASFQDLTTFTVLVWCFPTSFPSNMFLWSVGSTGQKRWLLQGTTGDVQCQINFTGTSPNTVTTTGPALSTWSCLAMTWDNIAAVKCYLGTLTTPMAELSYGTAVVGSGTPSTESGGAMNWGNRVAQTNPFVGEIARCQYWNAALSLAELQRQQFRPSPLPSCKVFMELGYVGTGTQPDWSGTGNVGTVTGATVSAGPPLPAPFGFRRLRVPYVVAHLLPTMMHHGG